MAVTEHARAGGIDAVLALGLLLATQVELWVLGTPAGPRPVIVAVDVLVCVALVWRRRRPLVTVAGASASALLSLLVGGPSLEADAGLFAFVASLVAVHAAGAYLAWRIGIPAALVLLLAQVIGTIFGSTPRHSGDYLWLVVITAAVFVAGRLQAVQRNQLRSQSRQARRLLLEQQEREHQVKLEERRQIARELHDVISHGVALMVVQAGAAEAMLASDPAQARRLLGAVQNTGERAANDLRRQLGLLGQDDDVMPAPRLADVRLLVADLQAGGLRVTLRTDGPLDNVEPSTGLAAYRIVQESLTNVIKHAPHAQVDVAVAVTADALDLVIVDNGGAPADSAPPPASGHGLVGMRERVELYGGHLAIAPDAAGFKVHARLPLEADTHAPVVEVTDDA